MATIKDFSKMKILLRGLSGKIGGFVFRQVRGRTVISTCPRKPVRLTAHQKKRKEIFLKAAQYAKGQLCDPVSAAEYRKGITDRKHSAYVVAMTDYLKAPEIHRVDTSNYHGVAGGRINVHATDDFRVVSVDITIIDPDGVLIEQGPVKRRRDNHDLWCYKTTRRSSALYGTKIIVTARDKPGNATTCETVITPETRYPNHSR